VTDVIAEGAGELANRFLRARPGADPVDYVIAATAVRCVQDEVQELGCRRR
jgi:predicted nucleic acid-binding protein